MPHASRETASHVEDMGIMEGRYEELGGYTVGFEHFREEADATPLFSAASVPAPARTASPMASRRLMPALARVI